MNLPFLSPFFFFIVVLLYPMCFICLYASHTVTFSLSLSFSVCLSVSLAVSFSLFLSSSSHSSSFSFSIFLPFFLSRYCDRLEHKISFERFNNISRSTSNHFFSIEMPSTDKQTNRLTGRQTDLLFTYFSLYIHTM